MIDEREDAEKALEVEGEAPTEFATVDDPTGADAVVAKKDETITDNGVVAPKTNPDQFESKP